MKLLDCCLDLLYPPRCVFCDALLQEGEVYFCRNCGEKVPMAEGRKRVRTGVYFDRCVAPLLYQDMVRESFSSIINFIKKPGVPRRMLPFWNRMSGKSSLRWM